MSRLLRIFLSSPGDVKAAREIAAHTIERLAQDYARFFSIDPYLWEYEAMVASGHFQDTIETPSNFDIVVLILWSRLGTLLPERTTIREYRGIDGRVPVTGTEWEFEDALRSAQEKGVPDLLVYRSREDARVKTWDAEGRQRDFEQLAALDRFWSRYFAGHGAFLGAYMEFASADEFAVALEKHLRQLIEKRIAIRPSGAGEQVTRVWMQAPFRGLEAYEFAHAPIFFGQDEALAKAMVRLTANAEAGSPFLLVLGASGSGKSSLVKAGIVPKLFLPRRIPGAAFLRHVTFRPSDARSGEGMFDALARRLTTQGDDNEGLPELLGAGQSPASLAAHLRNASSAPAYPVATALGQIAVRARQEGRMLEHETARLVLVVDQLEELFTTERITVEERGRFIDLLAGLIRSGLVWIVATMRKDFWHRADETPELVRMAEGNGRIELLPPSTSQLSQIIQRPAEAAGIRFEHHAATDVPLNEVITEEVAREPGALPLLSYLLDQLYRSDVLEAHGTALTFATYEKLGRLEGAIATKAEAVLDSCAPGDRQALGSVLFALIQLGVSDGDIQRAISRRVPLSKFPPGTPQRRLVEALLHPDARLLVSDSEQEGLPTVRVAHEALITRWAKACEFVHGNAQALKIRRRIEERYALWRGLDEADEDPASKTGPRALRGQLAGWRARFGHEPGLLSEIDLIDGQRLLREHRTDTEPQLIDYIERSVADDKRVRYRSVRVLAAVAGVVTILAILASAAGLVALQKQHEAESQTQQTREAQTRSLTEAASERLKESDVQGAQAIILEVLTNPGFDHARPLAANSLFQEVRAADSQLALLSGHSDIVRSAAFSSDGRRIVTSSLDRTARVWDPATGVQLAVLSGHGDWVLSAAFSPDGRRIVTASADKTARVWDAISGKQLTVLSGHGGTVFSAAFSPDGRSIVTTSDKTARIWDEATGAQLAVLSGHDIAVINAAFSPDGDRVVTASADKTARVWKAATGKQLAVLSGHGDWVLSAMFSPDGRRIVTASSDRTARVWDAATGKQVAVLSGHGDRVQKAAWSPDGRRIVTASFDKTARIWDAASGAQLAVLSGHDIAVTDAAFSPDGRIVTASADKTARIWDTASGVQLAVLSGHGDAVASAIFSPDGRRIVTASSDGTARVWDAATGKQLVVLSGHGDRVQKAAWSPDGRRIVTASFDKTARIWDAASGAQLAVLSGHDIAVTDAAFSPDGQRVVTASLDQTARVWDAAKGVQLAILSGHGDSVSSAAFSPDGRRIVTASADKTARVWDAVSGRQVAVLSGHDGAVFSAEFSPDGRRVVTASRDKTARVWDEATGAQLAVLSGHDVDVTDAAFSPDGRRIVTASLDKTARVWDAATGVQLAVLSGHGDAVHFAAFSPDGRRIVTASSDRTARVWDARIPTDPDQEIIWDESAEFDTLSNIERTQLGLPIDARIRTWSGNASKCDLVAAATYDPDRRAPGVVQAEIFADVATAACAQEIAKSGTAPRLAYQSGRALLAKRDLKGARRELELAVSEGYRAAQIDLANLLLDRSARMLDPVRAVTLYAKAWQNGVPIAAFQLGRLYEYGVHGDGAAQVAFHPDRARAWVWYGKGAAADEPDALARFGEKDDSAAVTAPYTKRRDAMLLDAFRHYAAAAERAHDEDWPDDAWKQWRYRRATLARLLARDGMMQQVADAYTAVRSKWRPRKPTLLQRLAASLGL